jgi:hypothetical protein
MVTKSGSTEPLHHIHQDEARLDMIERACAEASFGLDGWIRLPKAEDWAVYNRIAHESQGYDAEWNAYVYDSPIDEVISMIETGYVEWGANFMRMDPDDVILALCRVYGAATVSQYHSDDESAREAFRERYARAGLRKLMRERQKKLAEELAGPPLEVDESLF